MRTYPPQGGLCVDGGGSALRVDPLGAGGQVEAWGVAGRRSIGVLPEDRVQPQPGSTAVGLGQE